MNGRGCGGFPVVIAAPHYTGQVGEYLARCIIQGYEMTQVPNAEFSSEGYGKQVRSSFGY